MRAISLLFLLACAAPPTYRYEGLPAGTQTCSWDIVHPERGQCIVDSKRFRCFRQGTQNVVVSCMPYRLWR